MDRRESFRATNEVPDWWSVEYQSIEETKMTPAERGCFDLGHDVLQVLDIAAEVQKGEIGEGHTSGGGRTSACSMSPRSRVLESEFK
jgi:hypothetical protein